MGRDKEAVQLSRKQITTLGNKSIDEYDTIVGNCRQICKDLKDRIYEEYQIGTTIIELQVGDLRETHFVLLLLPENFSEDVSSRVIIDPTIAQFATENQHHDDVRQDFGPKKYLDTVGIYTENCEERLVWYHLPKETDMLKDPLVDWS